MDVMYAAEHRSLIVPLRADTEAIFVHGQRLNWNNRDWLVVPHGHSETRVLRSMGVDVPMPIMTHYDWRNGTPWEIQKQTAAVLTAHPRVFVLNSLGTGKTRAVLWASDFLMQMGEVKRALVVAPLSVLDVVWKREIFKTLPGRRSAMLRGTMDSRVALLDDVDGLDYLVVNPDLLDAHKDRLKQMFKDGSLDLLVLDELSMFRNRSTVRWKVARIIANEAPRVWGLTGTPTPQAPTDAWAEIKLVNPTSLDMSFATFEEKTTQKISHFRRAQRPGAAQYISEVMRPSVRFVMNDVMELPPVSYQQRDVAVAPKAQQAYKELINVYRAEVNKGEPITAVNDGVKFGKLLQVSCGLVYDDSGAVQDLGSGSRISEVEHIVQEADRKVIVFAPYRHSIDKIAQGLREAKHTVEVIDGRTSDNARARIFTQFETMPTPRVLVAHPRAMAHGVTLVAANIIIWFSPAPSYEIYEQANARIIRPGQTHKQLILEMAATPAEKMRYRQLRNREALQNSVLTLLKGLNED